MDTTAPKTVKEVQSFLGMIEFYSEFILDFASFCEPLHSLTWKEQKFKWDDVCQNSFNLLKSKISSGHCLAIFDPELPIFLTAETSDVGLRAILSQIQQDG